MVEKTKDGDFQSRLLNSRTSTWPEQEFLTSTIFNNSIKHHRSPPRYFAIDNVLPGLQVSRLGQDLVNKSDPIAWTTWIIRNNSGYY